MNIRKYITEFTGAKLQLQYIMYKPFTNAKILLVWINGKPAGHIQYSWKNARANAEKFKGDIFATNQIEILDIETGEIVMIQKGVKQQVTPSIVHPK